jgi:5-methylcytosine-specific restriction endonuclease McrA
MSLRSLSDNEILSRILRLTRRERSVTLLVLLHLIEIERRRLHLKQGYGSMHAYCTSGLGYSHSAANRRVRTARCVARFPEVHDMLKANEVNLSTIAQVSRILTPGNKDDVLSRIRGKSQREVEAVAAEYEPRDAMPRDRVRSVVVRVPVAPLVTASGASSPLPIAAAGQADDLGEAPATESAEPPQATATWQDRNGPAAAPRDHEPVIQLEKRAMIEFCASAGFMALYEKFRSLMWHRLPVNPSMEAVLSLALEYVIEREDPEKRRERRARRSETATPRTLGRNPRHIPARVRDEVFARDRGSCSFTGPAGRRCGSTHALQVDHVVPVARGGEATVDNLRLLCAYHNRVEAERILGKACRPIIEDRSGRGRMQGSRPGTTAAP